MRTGKNESSIVLYIDMNTEVTTSKKEKDKERHADAIFFFLLNYDSIDFALSVSDFIFPTL